MNNASLYNISADPSETTDLSAELSDQAQQMRERLEAAGKERLCRAGAAPARSRTRLGFEATANSPAEAQLHQPARPCSSRAGARLRDRAPAPAPAQPLLKCDKKLGSFCEHSGRACDASPTDPAHVLHTGNEALGACERLCEANPACNCISYAHDAPRAKTKCKLFRGVVGLKQEKSRDAYVPSGGKK